MKYKFANFLKRNYYRVFPKPKWTIDFHVHTTISDGQMTWQEVQRYYGLRCIDWLVTDHASLGDYQSKIALLKEIPVLHRGVELHIPKDYRTFDLLDRMGKYAKNNSCVTLVHSFNRETDEWIATKSRYIDIWAHPGRITPHQAEMCANRGIMLEITANPCRMMWNSYIERLAKRYGAMLSYGTDAHFKEQLL